MDKMKALDKEGRDEVAAILDPNISYKNQDDSWGEEEDEIDDLPLEETKTPDLPKITEYNSLDYKVVTRIPVTRDPTAYEERLCCLLNNGTAIYCKKNCREGKTDIKEKWSSRGNPPDVKHVEDTMFFIP